METKGHWIVMTSDGVGTCPWDYNLTLDNERHAQELADELVTKHWYIKQAWPEYVKGEGR